MLKVAVKKANVGGPVKPTVNSILLEIGQVNPHINAPGRARYVGLYIKALVLKGVVMRSVVDPVFICRLSAKCFRCQLSAVFL